MPSTVPQKSEVACELLDRAIELFLRGDSYYAALHLGGASEEILTVYAREVPLSDGTFMEPTFDQMKRAIVALSHPTSEFEAKKSEKWAHDRMSRAKNSVKHKRGSNDRAVDFEIEAESYDIIDRAITTYFQLWSQLDLPYLPLIQAFDQARRTGRRT